MMGRVWMGAVVASLALFQATVQAQDINPGAEYSRRLKMYEKIDSGLASFGEQYNAYNGTLSFHQRDIELEGIGPKIVIARDFGNATMKDQMSVPDTMGDWSLSIPRIETGLGKPTTNGTVSDWWRPAGSYARCTNFDQPYYTDINDVAWWPGYELVTETGSRQLIMKRAAENTLKPSAGNYPAVTNSGWQIGCTPSLVNGTGEGFLVVAPDGTKYTMNYLVSYPMYTLFERDYYSGTILRTRRAKGVMYVTRVEDRFGNYLTYQYNGSKLGSITASDGRRVDIQWRTDSNLIQSISVVVNGAAARTWNYAYSSITTTSAKLGGVTLPDGSSWAFNINGVGDQPANFAATKCGVRTVAGGGATYTSTITSPTGATGTFVVQPTVHAKSYAYSSCYDPYNPPVPSEYESNPPLYTVMSLISKSISGPGISPQNWTYQYSQAVGSTSSDACYANNSCADSKWVKATKPDGSSVTHTFSTRNDKTEGQLRLAETREADGTILSSSQYIYAASDAGPWPTKIGDPLVYAPQSNSYWMPVRYTITTQQGATFHSYVNSYDQFAGPVSVGKWSSLGYGKTDVTEYWHDLSKWVIGQVLRTYNANTGIEISRTDYNAGNALPERIYSYSKLQQSLTYHADGTVASVTDGNGNVTHLSNWMRGIPRSIQFADGTTQSAVVDDHGRIISVTDENGISTGYGYDVMGRLAGISYPSEDAFGYHTVGISYQQINYADRGLSAGHWRITRTEGNKHSYTYLDGLARAVMTLDLDASDTSWNTQSQIISRYDAEGRVVFQSYPTRHQDDFNASMLGVYTSYDPLGRVKEVKQDSEHGLLTTRTEYLSNLEVRITNPRGFQTVNGYVAYDQPTFEMLRWSAQPEGKTVEIVRDIFGKPTSLTQRAQDDSVSVTRRYVYRADGQTLCKTIEPETGSTIMDFDGAGNLGWSAAGVSAPDANNCDFTTGWNSGRRSGRTYDTRNRLVSLSFPDGRGNQAFEYWPDGLQKKITTYNDPGNGAPVINEYVYNRRRLLAGESQTQPGWYTWSIGYGYDAHAHLSSLRYPDSMVVTYSPNGLGQPTSVVNTNGQVYASGVNYYPNGSISQFTYGNGIVHSMQQNARQLPDRVTSSGGVLDYQYHYDANANPHHIANMLVSGYDLEDRWMGYDGLDRLTDAGSGSFGGDHWHRIRYNALDNIVSNRLPGVKDYAAYIYDGNNRLTQINNSGGTAVVSLSYDVQGNLSTKSGKNYGFDFGNRLRSTNEEWYRYDGAGRRVLKWRATEPGELSIYSAGGQLMYEDNYRADTRKSIRYVYLAGSLIATRDYGFETQAISTKYHHTDALGSPAAVTNESAQVIERTQWEPYGAAINKPAYDGVGYTGHMMDGATGLTYMQQRYYDPQIGRFLSVDPVTANSGTGANFNRYWYANNNPYAYTDPDGRRPRGMMSNLCQIGGCDAGSFSVGNTPIEVSSDLENIKSRMRGATKKLNSIIPMLLSKRAKKSDGIAAYFAYLAQPISTKYSLELYATLVRGTDGWRIEDPYVSNLVNKKGIGSAVANGPDFGEVAIHTHPDNSYRRTWHSPFSWNDVQNRGIFYVSLPNGSLYKHDPRLLNEIYEVPMK